MPEANVNLTQQMHNPEPNQPGAELWTSGFDAHARSQYRLSVASEGSVYNQPPHPGFFLDDDTNTHPLPARRTDIDVSRVKPLD